MEGQWNPMTPSKFIPIKRAQQISSPNWLESLDSNEGGQLDCQSGGDLHTLVNNNEGQAQMNYRRLLALNNPEIMKEMNSVHFMATQFGGGGIPEMNGENSHRSPLTVNGKILLSSNRENGMYRFLPLLEPKPQYKMAIPLLPNPNSLPQNATETVSPSTPATIEKNQRESLQDDSPRETNDLVGETSNEHLQQCFSNQVDSSKNATSQHQEGESNVVLNSSEEISAQQCDGKNQDITPQQKPRRKKHRPKVIHEGKPARTPKRATPKPATPGDVKTTENPSGKRKYVRKKKDSDQQVTPSSTTREPKFAEPDNRSRNKPVICSLNFDLDDSQALDRLSETGKPARTPKRATPKPAIPGDVKTTENPPGKRKYVRKKKDGDQQGTPSIAARESKIAEPDSQSRKKPVRRSLNFDLEDSQALDRLSEMQGREAAVSSSIKSLGQTRDVIESSTGCGVGFDLNVPANQYSNENAIIPQTPNRPPHHINHSVNENVKTPQTPNQPLQFSRLEMMKRKWQDDFKKMLFNMTPHHQSEKRKGESSKKLHKKINCENFQVNHSEVSENDPKGTKRNNDLVDNCQVQTKIRVSSSCSPTIYKKIRSENEQVFSYNASSMSIHTPNGWRTVHAMQNNTREAFTFADAQRFMDVKKRKFSSPTLVVNRVVRVSNDTRVQRSRINHCTVAEDDKVSSPTKMNYNQPPTPEKRHEYSDHEEDEIYGAKARVQALIAKQMRSKIRRRRKKVQDPLVTFMATNAKMELVIDYIVRKLKYLNINGAEKMFTDEPQNALIPYIGGGGAMVQLEGAFNLFKKIKKPRAKVELDSESNRVWKLLMGKECEGGGGTDADKEKWWEEERQVFRGRVDSFIARMHLIQGDRTFSRWKGSVVDSVIGVFLTQNVSDHLSSSAFMCLAARFPPQSKVNSNITNVETIRSPIISEPEFCDQSISGMGESGQMENKEMTNNNKSLRSNTGVGGVEYTRKSCFDFRELDLQIGQGSPNSVLGEDGKSLEDAASSQNSVASSQNSVQCSPMNFEGDNLVNRGRGNGFSSFTELLHMANNQVLNDMNITSNARILCEEYGGGIDWSALLGIDKSSPVSNEGNKSYVPSSAFESNSTNITERLITNIANCADSCSPRSMNAAQPVTSSCIGVSPLQSGVRYCCQSETYSGGNVSGKCLDQHDGNTAEFQMERSQKEIDTKAQTCSQNDNQMKDLRAESNLRNEAYSYPKANTETVNNESKGKKVKAEADKMKTYDWDSLRKQACENGIRKERTHGTMDTLDYEAVRNADVGVIAHTIRERGMNNLLAERIKDFLNRLVRDHGSIDLEWLRDVPPDKAKDYLLSIRGLGLKSVECVRLLTLHHLAFPVDTNVGRICVRLGWVPLQPLPESLQLHLLEMYPVLETIQKYLWPRLCKLDQRTLYELHYQLITFGKVFCTKSKPNCNACPMRGECKHFASAFASARLALPGPEEKRIVSLEVPLSSEQCPGPVPNPLPLPQLEGSTLQQEHTVPRNCEPIVEEPATPEPECTEASVIDIEDAFYNDPDEIPTIKLNFEEFTQNLHNYMQENSLGLQDGDLSKALVALTPEAASIPVAKLKNVNRLRTEHQVYELPDSHPLLEGMDKREPDDPCPYLLAIWTPGETAQSIEAPKSCCNSQDMGKLCGDNTCFGCNSMREAQAQTVRGTILIPCRTANRGSFPLNGTYFQVNEVFADHDSSRNPIDVPRNWIWNLGRRTVYFGTSIPSIFKGLTTEGIQHCFWRGFVCVRGFDRMTRAPKPLFARLHFPASKVTRNKKTPVAPATSAQPPPPPPQVLPPMQEK